MIAKGYMVSYNKKLFNAAKTIYDKAGLLEKELSTLSDDFKRISEINKILKNNKEIIELYKNYYQLVDSIENFDSRIKDEKNSDMQELIKIDFEEAIEKIIKMEENIKILLLPKDDNNERNIIVEMRPAAGGDEASIFVANLYETYVRYAQNQN